MAYITAADGVRIHYQDRGSGPPVVLVPGYGPSWQRQVPVLLAAGHQVITYDRRSGRHDYDTLAADLAVLLEQLDLTGAVLAGMSLGTGEVARYLGAYGSGRVRKAVLIGAVPPFLLETPDNLDGLPVPADLGQTWGDAWRTDFRADLPRIDVPVLLMHGEADRITPIDATANRLPDLIADLRYEVIPDGPHDIAATHPSLVNRYLLDFVAS